MQTKDELIMLLAKASKKVTHELIEECLIEYNKDGTKDLTVSELHNFCVAKRLL